MVNKIKTFLILGIIFFAAVLRLYKLGEIPSGFFRDEAAIGYNAFTLWESGKDEFGMRFPLVFRSFEVFFLPLYIYVTAPIVGILGLTEFSSRLLSSLSGIATVFFVYLIAKRVWNYKAGLFAAFVLAIAPWHIYYSRGTFEGNLALALFTGGFYFWITFLEEKAVKYYFASIVLFALSMYSYQAERLVVPLFAGCAIILSRIFLKKMSKSLVLPSVLVAIILIPLFTLTFSAGGLHRASGVSVFSKTEPPVGWITGHGEGFWVNNTIFLRGRQLLALYGSYFSPRNVFFEGDFDKQRSVPDYSVFYSWMLPFLILGIYQSFKNRKTIDTLLVAWTLIAPIPASATADPFHTYRSLLLYMPLSIFIGRGIGVFSEKVTESKSPFVVFVKSSLLIPIFLVIGILSSTFFIFNYAIISQAERARNWDYGYREIVTFINRLPEGTKVIVEDPWTEGYIHLLFFGEIKPELYHTEVAKLGDVASYYYKDPREMRPNKIGSVEFRKVDWPAERGDQGTYFVMWHESLPESEFRGDPHVELVKVIQYPNGKPAYRIVRIKE